MPVIQAENVLDFVKDTLNNLGKPKFTDISSNLQEHVAMKNLLRKNRVILESGAGIQFNVLTGQSNAFRNVGLAETDNANLQDGMQQASTVWRHSQTSYAIIRQLMSMNREPARIVDYVRQQRIMAMISLAEGMERNFWSPPSATDGKTPLGIPYWITKNGTKGFSGGTLSGYSTVAGLSPTTFTNWNNWAGPYTAVSKDDFVRAIREMSTKIRFKPPVDGIPTPNTGDMMGWYTNYPVYQPLEESLESQNDNLGKDIASMDGQVVFKRVAVTWVPFLDTDTTNPFYGINWGWLKTYILRDEWLRETNIVNTPMQHNVASHYIDLSYNFVSKNRRCHGVISNGTTYPG